MAASAVASEKIKGRDPFGFADSKIEKMMKKQGWNRGEGLGSSQVGDASFAIKVKRKNTKSGLGDDPGKDFKNDWWHKIFDNAAKNIGNIEPEASTDIKESLANEMKKPLAFRAAKLMKGAMFVPVAFVKRETLTTGDFTALNEKEEEKEKQKKAEEEKKKQQQQQADSGVMGPSYDELFAACDGLMVHKGARHGLNYKGKLERLREQEANMLKRMCGEAVDDEKQENKAVKEEKLVLPVAAENKEETGKKVEKLKKKKQKKSQGGLNEKSAQVKVLHEEKATKKKKKRSEKAPEEVTAVSLVNEEKTTKKKRKKSKKAVEDVVETAPEACEAVEVPEKSKKSKKRKLKDQSDDGDNVADTQTTTTDVAERPKKKKKKSVEGEKIELAAKKQKKKKSDKSQK